MRHRLSAGAVLPPALVVLVALHIPSHARELTETDSINLAKALHGFNVVTHSPHPPGYPLVVLAAHVAHFFTGTVTAYLTVDLLFSVATVVFTYFLGRELFGPRAGAAAAVILVATPLFWYYGDVVSVYPTESAGVAAVTLLGARVARRADERSALLLLPALALVAGFRPTMLGLMAPTALVALRLGHVSWRSLLASGSVAAGIVAAWAVPMVVKSGGWAAYSRSSSTLYGEAARKTSLFYGAPLTGALTNVAIVVAATLSVAAPAALFLLVIRRRQVAELGVDARRGWLLLVAWVAPYLLLYLLVHFGKPGYALAYVPAVATAAGALVGADPKFTQKAAAFGGVAIVAYLLLPAWPLPVVLRGFWPTARSVHVQDVEARGLERLAAGCPAARCTIVSLPATPRYWYHDPRSIGSLYAPGARVVRTSDLTRGHPTGRVLWVGERVPAAVRAHATRQPDVGSWQVWESVGPATLAIVGMDESAGGG